MPGVADRYSGLTWSSVGSSASLGTSNTAGEPTAPFSTGGCWVAVQRRVISFGAYYGSVSRAIPGAGRELALELNYQLVVRRWFTVTPDLQYISRPGGTSSSLPSATLLGVQLLLVF